MDASRPVITVNRTAVPSPGRSRAIGDHRPPGARWSVDSMIDGSVHDRPDPAGNAPIR